MTSNTNFLAQSVQQGTLNPRAESISHMLGTFFFNFQMQNNYNQNSTYPYKRGSKIYKREKTGHIFFDIQPETFKKLNLPAEASISVERRVIFHVQGRVTA